MQITYLSVFVAEKWTAIGTEECPTACAALGLRAVGMSNGGNEGRYICSGDIFGYRPGYKTVDVAGCYAGDRSLPNYACLCDYTKGYRFEWKAAPGLLPVIRAGD